MTTLLNELAQALRSCIDVREAVAVIREVVAKAFPPAISGCLYLSGTDGREMDVAAAWGDAPAAEPLRREDCWGLRQRHAIHWDSEEGGLRCRHGHDAGDEVLKAVAGLLRAGVRQGDTALFRAKVSGRNRVMVAEGAAEPTE